MGTASKKSTGKKKGAPKKAAKPKSDVSVEDDDERDPRLVPPKKTFSGESERANYQNWRRGITVWRNQYDHQSESKLGAKLMEVVVGDAEDLVFATLEEGTELYDEIMRVLDGAFGERGLPESLSAINTYNACSREKDSLGTFLTKYKTARAKALKYGLTTSEKTDGAQLLQKAELTSTQATGVLQALRIESKLAGEDFVTPRYTPTLEALEMLAQTLAAQDVSQGRQKRPAALLAGQPEPKYPRKGKDGKDKGGGKGKYGGKKDGKNGGKGGGGASGQHRQPTWRDGDWSCPSCKDHQFAKNEKCRQCGSANPTSAAKKGGKDGKEPGKKGDGKGKGPSKQPCREHVKGTCQRGATCWFSHST